MSNSDQHGEGAVNQGQLVPGEANPLDRFVDRADLTALALSGLVLKGASVQQALFSGTLFRDCTFERCDFRRADFEGAIFESCILDDCDFSIADLRSVEAARTSFLRCRFDEGSTRSSTFSECLFDRCRIVLHNFEENRLEGSKLLGCSFERSTVLHCEFMRTHFETTDLADCTSQFHVFEECTFADSRINAEAVGLTFGLSSENLNALGLMWRGTGVEKHHTITDLAADLVTTYVARGWFFAAGILKLNFGIGTRIEALGEIFSALEATVKSSRPLKIDEIRFFASVVEHLSKEGHLPFVSIARGLDMVVSCAEARGERDSAPLKPLYHALKDAELVELAVIERGVTPLEDMGADRWVSAAFVFSEEPPISFRHWLEDMHSSGLLTGSAPRFRSSANGSYIELFYICAGTLASLLICLSLLERIVERLVYIRARSQVLFADKLPAVVRRRALQPIAIASPTVARELRGYIDASSGAKGAEFVSEVEGFAQRLTKVEIDTNVESAT
jgi:fluoroquinolone resistance protein